MHVRVFMFVEGDNEKFTEMWNRDRQNYIKMDDDTLFLNLPKHQNLYIKFKEMFSRYKDEFNLKFRERLEPRFSRKDYSRMDALYLNTRQYYDREEEDIKKSYSIENCSKCKRIISLKQHSPLIFSNEVFEEEIDVMDVNLTEKSDLFVTSFGELVVSDRIYSLTKEADIKGVEFEPVTFSLPVNRSYYQVQVKRFLGKMINSTSKKTCSECGLSSFSKPNLDYQYFPFESCPNVNLDWRLWAFRVKKSGFEENDLLLTKENFGWKPDQFDHDIIISPKYYELLKAANIREFYVQPVELVDVS